MAKNRRDDELQINLGEDEELQVNLEDEEQDENKEEETKEVPHTDDSADVVVQVQNMEQEPPAPKRVKIKVNKYHRCCIGGVWYEFHPGKEYNVPQHVKEILRNGNVLMPV